MSTRKTTKTSSNRFDKIFKENLDSLIPVILRRVVHLEIDRMETLTLTKQQTTREREPDFACIVYNKDHPGVSPFTWSLKQPPVRRTSTPAGCSNTTLSCTGNCANPSSRC